MKFSYGKKVKPITIFICERQGSAKKRSDEFINFLADHEFSHINALSERNQEAREKVIVVTSNTDIKKYKDKPENIEEINPQKIGGKVEYIFAVNKLSEGWDVDNVFQIVPLEERVFNSKLLISQVLGRRLRIPRKISYHEVIGRYPIVTVTNHDKFATHIKELLDAVVESDLSVRSHPLDQNHERSKYHFDLFNLYYLPEEKFINIEKPTRNLQVFT